MIAASLPALVRPAPRAATRPLPGPAAAVAWEDAHLPMLTERQMAARERDLGRRVVEHRGRWWVRVAPGVYQPVCLMSPLRPEQATRPTRLCWGFRAGLAPEHAGEADVAIPVHLLPDPGLYHLGRLAASQRRRVLRGLREFDIVALASPEPLLAQGHAVAREAHARNPRVPTPSRRGFERWVASHFAPPRGLVLAAFRHGRLLAFNTQTAADGVVYGEAAYAGAEARRHGLTACLFHAAATIASRTAGVRAFADGQHARESPGLCEFKRALGLELARVPARAWLAPLAGRLLRRARPHTHYRLTGRG